MLEIAKDPAAYEQYISSDVYNELIAAVDASL